MRAITVCVEYSDYLSHTLPYNRHQFSEWMIVTTPEDKATHDVASSLGCLLHTTRAFYDDGAEFNKWKALEEALDKFGRFGWLCLMDADILWPREVNLLPYEGFLYTPRRRMMKTFDGVIPQESDWRNYPLHPNDAEFAGYSQLFHANDPALPQPPWHETNWRHAGGADSFFQRLWAVNRKERPNFECLHLGPAGVNWCGRSTQMLDGTISPNASQRRNALREMTSKRRRDKVDPYEDEKLS